MGRLTNDFSMAWIYTNLLIDTISWKVLDIFVTLKFPDPEISTSCCHMVGLQDFVSEVGRCCYKESIRAQFSGIQLEYTQ